ncbi:MAG: TraB/GumN family protein [Pseudomonadota bacterium]
MRTLHTFAVVLALLTLPLAAQSPARPEEPQAPQNAIVVTAQRSGAPMWTIDTEDGSSTVILVGEIRRVPEVTPWQPDRLKDATAEADRVIISARPKFSPGDFFRLLFRGGKFLNLPKKTVAGDYLDTAQRARLAALEEKYDKDYDRRSFLITGFNLLTRQLDFDDDTLDDDATDIVKKAAKKAKVPITSPERFRGEDLLDNLAQAEPASHIPCLEAAMTATEAGPGIIEARGRDWTKFNVPAVMENPLEVALGQCWPWADPEVGTQIRDQWTGMIAQAGAQTGTTLAVVPLRVLAERDGVLDQLERQGFDIAGPEWRAPQDEAPQSSPET